MYKLKVIVSQSANYVYHMMSVSKVGYDNSYARKYREIHPAGDLKILKENETYLTVSGGEHCGMLYTLLVGKPASANSMTSLKRYYASIIDLFSLRNYKNTAKKFNDLDRAFLETGLESFEDVFSMCLNAFSSLSDEILILSEIMLRNIEVYENNVWEVEKRILLDYKEKLAKALEVEYDLVSKWEMQLDTKLSVDNFEVVIVTSIEGGAQAIDISETKDLFNINEDVKSLIGFISHEIGIYIILQSMPLTVREDMQKYWLCIESLATYHNQKVLYEDEDIFAKDNKYFEKFIEIYDKGSYKDFLDIIEQTVG